MSMIQLQFDFTTPEQSKRLLELGVPKDSANFFYVKFECETFPLVPLSCHGHRYSEVVPLGYEKNYRPCWSIFRLMEIYNLCNDDIDNQRGWAATGDFDYMEYVISRIEDGIMNFNKLNE